MIVNALSLLSIGSCNGIFNSKYGCHVKNSVDNLNNWTGKYRFEEYTEPNIARVYTIKIYNERGKYYADIVIDGFQTMERLKAKLTGNQDAIKFVFEEYLPDNLYETYKKGDVLFEFKRDKNNIQTIWGRITPILIANEKNGIYFTKIN